jgi:hypothetical protein
MQEDSDIILTNALFAASLDNSSDDEIALICDRLNIVMGGDAYYAAIRRGIDWLKTGKNLEQLTPENKQRLMYVIIPRIVKEWGVIPGQDISSDGEGSFIVSHALIVKIAAGLPPGYFDQLKARTDTNET